jgi:aromatic-L-amino-acid decarboxylase
VLESLAAAIGCDGFVGTFTSGGSLGNLMALAMARESRAPANEDGAQPGAVVYASEEVHMSIPKAVAMLGLGRASLRLVPVDENMRIQVPALETAIARDREAGRRGIALVGSAGTIMSGAIDPLAELADVARRNELWFHVDGAYGASAALCPPGQAALAGMGRADSLTIDPHKWLFQPYEIGCLMVREPGALERAFALDGAYLRDTAGGAVNFRDRGLQLTRGGRALKLYLSMRVFGLEAFRGAIDRGIDLAEHAEETLRARVGWEVATPAQLGIVTFRRDGDDELQTAIAAALVRDGYAAPSTTVVGGRVALRLCTINPRTTFAEIDETIARMELAGDALAGG